MIKKVEGTTHQGNVVVIISLPARELVAVQPGLEFADESLGVLDSQVIRIVGWAPCYKNLNTALILAIPRYMTEYNQSPVVALKVAPHSPPTPSALSTFTMPFHP